MSIHTRILGRLNNADAWSHAVLNGGEGFDPICDAHEIVAEADQYRKALRDLLERHAPEWSPFGDRCRSCVGVTRPATYPCRDVRIIAAALEVAVEA